MTSSYPFRSHISGTINADHILPGSTNQFVQTGQTQTFTGDKTFSDDITISGSLSVADCIMTGNGASSCEFVINKGADSSTESTITFQRLGTTTFQIGELQGTPASLDFVTDSGTGFHLTSAGTLSLDEGLLMENATLNRIRFDEGSSTPQFYISHASDTLRIETNGLNGFEMSNTGNVTFERDVTVSQDLTVDGSFINIASQAGDSNIGTSSLDTIDVGSNLVGSLIVTVYNAATQTYRIDFTSPSTSNIVIISPRTASTQTFSYGVTQVSASGFFNMDVTAIGVITDFTFAFYYQIIPCTGANNSAWA